MPLLNHTRYPDFRVDEGEVVSVLGAPGSGKSRLALELAFLERPSSGDVLFHGSNPLAKRGAFKKAKRPHEVTVLVQNAEDQLFARTVFDDVAFGPRRLRLDAGEVEERVVVALATVRLDPEDVRSRSPFALSGGEKRRVALAGVLAMRPEVLILDEPTANLDPQTRNEFLDLLEPLRGTGAVVWLTSSAREATAAGRTYLLRDTGLEVVPAGTTVFHNWRDLERAGIELPGIYDLALALDHRGMSLPTTDSPTELKEAIIRQWRELHHDR
ncbi:MAG: ATP-binding cassette domain-containing protein [Chloroflexota bacterium]|nr:MAG: energy-coupling factor ABC transporter ATP-binding protein [Chloroflexota bacterium]